MKKVKCIHNKRPRGKLCPLTLNKEYDVIKDDHTHYYVEADNGIEYCFSKMRFVDVLAAQMIPYQPLSQPSFFRVGETVRCDTIPPKPTGLKFTVGKIYLVERFQNKTGDDWNCIHEDNGGKRLVNHPDIQPYFSLVVSFTIPTSGNYHVSGQIYNDLTPAKSKTCSDHKWQAYTGLRESYEFCVHCDVKRSV